MKLCTSNRWSNSRVGENRRLRLVACAVVALLVPSPWISADEVDRRAPGEPQDVVLVVGAAGTPEYGEMFQQWAARWRKAAAAGDCRVVSIGPGASNAEAGAAPAKSPEEVGGEEVGDADRLQSALASLPGDSSQPVWIVLIGHGTFDGKAARFNLRGLDMTAEDLNQWCGAITRPCIIINCASSSARSSIACRARSGRRHGDQERFRDELRTLRGLPVPDDRRCISGFG